MSIFQRLSWLQWFLLGSIVLIFTGTTGIALGYASGIKDREKDLAISIAVDTQIQFDLGLKDFEAGHYELARQRFEYVIQQNPEFPGVIDMLVETLRRLPEPVIQATDTLASPTPSPTPDTRPVDELFALAEAQFRNQEWKNLVQTIVSLRNIDPFYHTSEVDRMLFLGLRFSGIEKILNDGNLEGGVYDLALAERFAPLDTQARIYQEWARLYQIGVSFWGVFPDKSVYYFSQLASAAPYLKDFSGIFAKDRYRMALLQYGDRLSQNGEWCLAIEQYNLAQGLLEDQGLQPTMTFAEEQCLHGSGSPTPTPGPEIIGTPTLTLTSTLTVTIDATLTPAIEITLTPTPTEVTPEPSPTEPEMTPTPTLTTEP
ncbi:MAG: hypothetical protein KKD28_09865 [Chloroflexi bacterium]|nr:hypothetical protein [Chloroflexota bacterium]